MPPPTTIATYSSPNEPVACSALPASVIAAKDPESIDSISEAQAVIQKALAKRKAAAPPKVPKPAPPATAASPPKATKATKAKKQISPPDYDSWAIPDLQAETKKYGYKPAAGKRVLIKQLLRIWNALHPDHVVDLPTTPPPASKNAKITNMLTSTKTKVTAKVSPPVASESESEAEEGEDDVPAPAKKRDAPKTKSATAVAPKAKKRRESSASSGSESDLNAMDTDSDGSVLEDEMEKGELDTSFVEQMKRAVMKDSVLWRRILLYEVSTVSVLYCHLYVLILDWQPIMFEEMMAFAQSHSLKTTAIQMRNWLDKMAISFYMDPSKKSESARQRRRTGKRKPAKSKATPTRKPAAKKKATG